MKTTVKDLINQQRTKPCCYDVCAGDLRQINECLAAGVSLCASNFMLAGVVYCIACEVCNIVDVGNEATKMVGERAKEHTANACVKGHLEPTHLKSSPLFTFSTKS